MCIFYICTMNAELCLNSIYAVEAMFVGVSTKSSRCQVSSAGHSVTDSCRSIDCIAVAFL